MTTFPNTSYEVARPSHDRGKGVILEPQTYYQPLKSDDGPSQPGEFERPRTSRGRRSMDMELQADAHPSSEPQRLLSSRKARPKSAKGRTRPMPRTNSPSYDDDDLDLSPAEVLTMNNERSRINPTLDASQHWSSEATPSETLHHHLMYSSSTAPNAHQSYSSSSQLSFDPSAQDTEVLYSEDSPNV